jgi:hypothetical protein
MSMRIDITGLQGPALNRARAQLDAAGIQFSEEPRHGVTTLFCESDDTGTLRRFAAVALFNPAEKVYR